MTLEQEAQFERKAERYFKSQRELPKGRNFLWNTLRFRDDTDMSNYRRNFDNVFPDAPGAGI